MKIANIDREFLYTWGFHPFSRRYVFQKATRRGGGGRGQIDSPAVLGLRV